MTRIETFPDWIASRAITIPDGAALVVGGKTWTFAELDAEITRTARRLATLGVRPWDRVATLLHNGLAAAILPHATLRIGATLVPLNTRLSAPEIEWLAGDTQPRVVIAEGRTIGQLENVRRDHETITIVSSDSDGAAALGTTALDDVDESDVPISFAHDPDAIVAIIYTSGTTGQPKGAMLTVSNFWWSAIGSALNLGIDPRDCWLVCLPLYHIGGLSILMRSAIYGITAVVHDGFDEDLVNAAIDEGQVTMISVVGVMLERMLDARAEARYPATLRYVLLGGGPLSASLLERCAAPGIPVVPTYGLTETCSQVVTLPPRDMGQRPGTSGKVLYPNELRISVDAHRDGQPGESGEILVRGPVVMAGYAGRADETSRVVVGGWLHTGDVGRIDADGFLYVLDRRDDLIVTGGENVYPAEVEATLLTHPSVAEAGVIGIADSKWGQRVTAIVRLYELPDTNRVDAAQLKAYCEGQLAGYKTPRDFFFVHEPLPRTASGKIRRAALRKIVTEHPG
jgi:O-succinylbenzoic acid--CoA ligase